MAPGPNKALYAGTDMGKIVEPTAEMRLEAPLPRIKKTKSAGDVAPAGGSAAAPDGARSADVVGVSPAQSRETTPRSSRAPVSTAAASALAKAARAARDSKFENLDADLAECCATAEGDVEQGP